MGRNCDIRKETAMEALYQVMKAKKILKRPAPNSNLFYLVENAINLWKDDPNYWIEVTSLSEKKNCRNLLQTVSTWFDRRRNKAKANGTLKPERLSKWKEDIQIKKPHARINIYNNHRNKNSENNNAQRETEKKRKREKNISIEELYDQFQELKKENEVLKQEVANLKRQCRRSNSFDIFHTDFCIESKKSVERNNVHGTNTSINEHEGKNTNLLSTEHERKLSMGHIPVIHKSATCPTPHLDYMANGTLDCQHKSSKCCGDGGDTYEFLGKDMSFEEISRLLE